VPFVNVHMWTGRTIEQKRRLLRAITEAMVEHAAARPDHLHVTIQEYELENWARAGVLAADEVASRRGESTVDDHASDRLEDAAVDENPATGELHHVLLECGDLDASVRFYTEVVGVRIRKTDTHRDGRPLVLTHNAIGLTSAGQGGRNLDHLAFPVTSVADVLDRARDQAVPVVRGPGPGPYGHTVYLADPDGNEVELFEPTP
jgi:4-oxalocrotonate tautomerase family enzyme